MPPPYQVTTRTCAGCAALAEARAGIMEDGNGSSALFLGLEPWEELTSD